MEPITSAQKKFLRGLAHDLKPVAQIGQRGLTPNLYAQIEADLLSHELIKIRFVDFKQKSAKLQILEALTAHCNCHLAGQIGHTAILYRPHPEKDRRHITLP
jgi:RNA-binding protein